ncbi:hypothetical protein PP175_20605 [Aneurinibacillus sp. Ricciae_BoGa-3]|uniref:hypothetical protein n=1 Tax=Aneurinibacillus sp. Ricciae_BoGa-3 TaxID=3022697 RepID=UPI002340A402|nr:hypothetical protein [Aneurinibacillus sp. Ricciae_BoGa-3]WCK53706.1 hypothetical protein PP175_20605 [Aneurinibacillus sp. Ricciae_BoGa-3]
MRLKKQFTPEWKAHLSAAKLKGIDALDIQAIKRRLLEGESPKSIEKDFSISYRTIYRIKNGQWDYM